MGKPKLLEEFRGRMGIQDGIPTLELDLAQNLSLMACESLRSISVHVSATLLSSVTGRITCTGHEDRARRIHSENSVCDLGDDPGCLFTFLPTL